jgi:predicted DNA-binding transcriptional regulator AlpA
VLGTQMATKRKRIVNAGAVSQQTGTKRSLIWDYFNNDLDSHKWTHGNCQELFPTSRNAKSLMNISIGISFPSCFVHRFDRLFEEEIPLPEFVTWKSPTIKQQKLIGDYLNPAMSP